jgi:protein-disulfide isomerase
VVRTESTRTSGRARRAARRREQERATRRRRLVRIGGWIVGGIAAAGVAVGLVLANAGPGPDAGSSVSADDPTLGQADAPVTIVEYGDFKCPFCTRFAQETEPQLVHQYVDTGKVRLVWRDFPRIDAGSPVAAAAARCAAKQGRFWPYHDALYDYIWTNWYGAGRSAEGLTAYDGHYEELAQSVGLDLDAFRSCVSSGRTRSIVTASHQEGLADGVTGTPTFLVNGQRVVGAQPFALFAQLIDQELAQ